MGASVVAGCDTSPVLEATTGFLDAVALAIERLVVRQLGLAAACRGDARGDTAREQSSAKPVAVVATVGKEFLGWRQRGQEHRGALVVAHLSCGEEQQDRAALPVGDGVQLGV
jgi:hypothetical protein